MRAAVALLLAGCAMGRGWVYLETDDMPRSTTEGMAQDALDRAVWRWERCGFHVDGLDQLRVRWMPMTALGSASMDVPRIYLSTIHSWRTYDLESVMTHELGHVFGFDHSSDPTDVMWPAFKEHEVRTRIAGCSP